MSSDTEQLQRIVQMAQHVRELSSRLSDFIGEGATRPTPLQRAKQMIAMRHRRSDYFDADLFSDPAWDVLLQLYVAYEERTTVSVSNCCIAAGMSEMSGLRWIDVLKERGLIALSDDAGSDRRRLVRLTDPAHHAMRDLWQEQERI